MGHRPMYCSNWDSDNCAKYESIVRSGLPYVHTYALEPLFYKYGVDVEFWAHEHFYERMFPLYNRTVYSGTSDPYLDPLAPVHIVTGSAGCCSGGDSPFVPDPPPWSAFRSNDYGYSRMIIYNSTHLYLEQVSDDKNGTVVDSVMIRKNMHGPYWILNEGKEVKGTYIPLDIPPPNWYKEKCKNCANM